jgi:DNA-binding transcriptional ArsR family regulator
MVTQGRPALGVRERPAKTRERVGKLLDAGLTVGQAARRLGITPPAVSYHARKLGIPPSSKYAPRGDWDDIQAYYDDGHGVRECQECGLEDWLGEPLSMALHHVNGNGLDNRLGNIRLLCPNCHSQTPSFARGPRAVAAN